MTDKVKKMLKVDFGGISPISTIDWYGRSSSVIFLNGCNFRCPYCQNHKIVNNVDWRDIDTIKKEIYSSIDFISAVVFSGGEPTMQIDALIDLAKFSKENDLLVGIETNGYYPYVLKQLVEKNLVDKIFLDVKTDPLDDDKYRNITGGVIGANKQVMKSLAIKGVDIEARTTVFRSIMNDILPIAKYLKEDGYGTYVIQQGIPENAPNEEIRKEKRLTKSEMENIAKNASSTGIKIKIIEGKDYCA